MSRGALNGMYSSRGKAPKTFEEGRVCADPACKTKLSRYNAETRCFVHAAPQLVPRDRG
jgi:hypothetical protein